MTPQIGKQIVTIRISPNDSSSKGSHEKKVGQLIEYDMGTIF